MAYRLGDDSSGVSESLASLELHYTPEELKSFLCFRLAGLSRYSLGWPRRAAAAFWECTQERISKAHMEALRTYALDKFHSSDTQAKFLYYAKAFLTYLTKTRLDSRYESFRLFLELPKAVKTCKLVTGRIVTIEDVQNVLSVLKASYERSELDERHYIAYNALVTFGAFTGQRTYATIGRVTAGQFEEALELGSREPTLHVSADQDKIRMAHYVPLHPRVIEAVETLLNGKKGSEIMFPLSALNQWLWRSRKAGDEIPLSRCGSYFVLSDLRKFAEQHGDIIGWDSSNRAYVLTHDISGVSWSHYRNPLPENVYDTYMEYWKDVDFTV
jgi:integrase